MRGYRRRRHRAPWSRRRKRCCVLLVCLVLVAGIMLRLDCKLRPAILEIALSDLETVVNNTIDQVCIQDAADGEITYSKLVQLQYDQNGKLQGLTTDMATLNVLRADMTRAIGQALREVEEHPIQVPLGTAWGTALFSDLGPNIPVQVLSLESIAGYFESSFTSAGINQTRHQIQMVLTVQVVLLLPGGTYDRTFTNKITVAESILMGDVPSHYSYFSQFDTAREAADAQRDYSAE